MQRSMSQGWVETSMQSRWPCRWVRRAMSDDTGGIRVEATGIPYVARITIDRPQRNNAFSLAMVREFVAELSRVESDDDVKVIVVDATGPDLSRGLDEEELGLHHEHVGGVPHDNIPSLRVRLRAADEFFWGGNGLYSRLLKCPKVTVAAAKGRCLDVGLYLTLFCDIAVAAENATFGTPRW